jgi:hypothetical protein
MLLALHEKFNKAIKGKSAPAGLFPLILCYGKESRYALPILTGLQIQTSILVRYPQILLGQCIHHTCNRKAGDVLIIFCGKLLRVKAIYDLSNGTTKR